MRTTSSLLCVAAAFALGGCLIGPTADSRVGATDEPVHFTGYHLQPRSLVRLFASDLDASQTSVYPGLQVATAQSAAVGLQYPTATLYPFSASAVIPAHLWVESSYRGAHSYVRAEGAGREFINTTTADIQCWTDVGNDPIRFANECGTGETWTTIYSEDYCGTDRFYNAATLTELQALPGGGSEGVIEGRFRHVFSDVLTANAMTQAFSFSGLSHSHVDLEFETLAQSFDGFEPGEFQGDPYSVVEFMSARFTSALDPCELIQAFYPPIVDQVLPAEGRVQLRYQSPAYVGLAPVAAEVVGSGPCTRATAPGDLYEFVEGVYATPHLRSFSADVSLVRDACGW